MTSGDLGVTNGLDRSFPVAFHIGYHKTATTWLQQRFLPGHPAIQPYVRAGRPWDDPFLRYVVTTPDRCFSAGEAREAFEAGLSDLPRSRNAQVVVVSAERLSGHPFTGGHDSFRLAERLAACVPEARVFWVIRNQIDVVESVYKQLLGEGYRGRIADLFDAWRWKSVTFDLGNYEYDRLAAKYQDLFGVDRVGVLTYETLVVDSDAFLGQICAFLGIPPITPPRVAAGDVVHRSFPNRGLSVVRAINHVRRSELNPFPPVNLGSWWRTPIAATMRRLPERPTLLTEAQESGLRERFRPSNRRLVERVDGDFSHFLARMDEPRTHAGRGRSRSSSEELPEPPQLAR